MQAGGQGLSELKPAITEICSLLVILARPTGRVHRALMTVVCLSVSVGLSLCLPVCPVLTLTQEQKGIGS